jgi:Ig-like domain-containing protein
VFRVFVLPAVSWFNTDMTSRFILSRKLILLLGVYLWSCAPLATATPFIPPTAQPPLIQPTLIIQPTKEIVVVKNTPITTIIVPTATTNPTDCINNLTFVSDLTIPDGTNITYGSTIDKQWQVQNSGTCNWNSSYQLHHIGGAALGAAEVLALYPAKSGTSATIQITFTAPFTDGDYESAWQAFDPNGVAFGDPIYMRITVVSP